MNKKLVTVVVVAAAVVGLLLWAPWVTEDFAKQKVTNTRAYQATYAEKGLSPELGVVWRPFGREVMIGDEEYWIVNFWGGARTGGAL